VIVTFQNVIISIDAPTPEAAYDRLCNVFEPESRAERLEYTTDTYTTEKDHAERSTWFLWPDQRQQPTKGKP
jgi:hypothetical protein